MMLSKRYLVEAEGKPGHWTGVYEGNYYDQAKKTANFWDEYVNVRIIDREQQTTLDQKWDALFDRIKNDPTYGKAR